jgi:transposase
MIHPSHGVNLYVATKPVDFRKGHDGLAALVLWEGIANGGEGP